MVKIEEMKEEKLLKLWGKAAKFDRRLRLLENLFASYQTGILHTDGSNEKCKCLYNKIDFAQLFYILMDEGTLFFDQSDEKTNRSKFQVFLETNFTYSGDDGVQVRVKSISRQFSECKGYTYKEKQLTFLEGLIEKLQKRKSKLENW